MRLVTFRHSGSSRPGIVIGDAIHEITSHLDLRSTLGDLRKLKHAPEPTAWFGDAELLPPIPDPSKIICVGLNYDEHRVESQRPKAAYPTLFTRWPDTQVGHRQPLQCPAQSTRFDYEGELAVVIGKSARNVSVGDALGHVAGYTCYNDGSVRDWQKHTSQFTPGKNFPASAGFGPWLSVGEISRPALHDTYDKAERRDGPTGRRRPDDLRCPIAHRLHLVVHRAEHGRCHRDRNSGRVGDSREPQLYMKPGDVVEVEISGVGTLVNPVVPAQ